MEEQATFSKIYDETYNHSLKKVKKPVTYLNREMMCLRLSTSSTKTNIGISRVISKQIECEENIKKEKRDF
ncbi:hypothetical protein CHS0354_008160, partial [Potamilus streckersoni]